MRANLLLFKTVIAGDSWGQVAVPVIEAYPGTAVIFVGSLLSLVFGVLPLGAHQKSLIERREESHRGRGGGHLRGGARRHEPGGGA